MFLIFPQSGYNTRVKAMHIVNARPWSETLIAMIKFVLRNKIAGRVSVIQYREFGKSTYVYFNIYIYIYIYIILLFILQIKSCKI